MALAAGTRLGPYAIDAPLGAGGMGEVYKATDTRLERTVAIKVLPAHVASDPERRSRFEREAKTISSLNHPHICTLHDVGQEGDVDFLVMEYLEGETLADRLAKGPIPLDEALPIARQIAEALEAAHEQGVIHRNLKPANVKVKDDGTVKVLDFGLAKALAGDAESAAADASSPTMTMTAAVTKVGVVMGTAPYMSPEQARGIPVDKRADVWAFGCLLFELATGRRAFEGGSTTEVLAKILEGKPKFDRLPAATPEPVRLLLGRCLEKDGQLRLRDIREARVSLDRATGEVQGATDSGGSGGRRARPRMRTAGPLIAVGALVGLVVWFVVDGSTAPGDPVRLTITLPPQHQLVGVQAPVALSPDGHLLAYAARDDEGFALYLRPLDAFEATRIPGTTGGQGPFFSPDGAWIGFQQGPELKKVSVAGGLPVSLTACGLLLGASWGSDDSIVFADSTAPGLWQVPASGGTRQALTEPGGSLDAGHRFPYHLPGGVGVVFTAHGGIGSELALLPTGDREWRILATSTSRFGGMRYAPPGHLVYGQESQLVAAPFDLASGAVTGSAVPVVEEVARSPASNMAYFDVADDGTLVYASDAGVPARSRLLWAEVDGSVTEIATAPGIFLNPRLSPDGSRFVIAARALGEFDIWSFDTRRGVGIRLTTDEVSDAINPDDVPIWTANGERVTIAIDGNLHTIAADGDSDPVLLLDRPDRQWALDWSTDGQSLLFGEADADTQADVWVLSSTDGGAEPVVASEANESQARLSSGGDWLAYVSDETGRREVYVQSFRTPGQRARVSGSGGASPAWGANDETLFYRSRAGLVAVTLTAEPTPIVGDERVIIEGRSAPLTFDVSPDGRRFLTASDLDSGAGGELRVVLNWFEELKARVPVP